MLRMRKSVSQCMFRAVNARFLSTPSGPGNGDRDSMVEFMRTIAQKRDTAGDTPKADTLWSKLKKDRKQRKNFPKRDFKFDAPPNVSSPEPGTSAAAAKGPRILNDRGSGGKVRPKRSRGGRAGIESEEGERGGRGGKRWGDGETSLDDIDFRTSRRGKFMFNSSDLDMDDDLQLFALKKLNGDYDDDNNDDDKHEYDEDNDEDFGDFYDDSEIDEREEDDEPQLTEMEERMLGMSDSFRDMASKGEGIDIECEDAMEEFLVHAFEEAYKSQDDTYRTVVLREFENRRRVPITRSLAQLRQYCVPPTLKHSAPDTNGAKLAAQAWGVIHQNYFYQDSEKYRLVERIATVHNKVERALQNNAKSHLADEMLFNPKFRKGDDYLERELELLRQQSRVVEEDNTFVQGETDWNVEAVVDEDQL